MTYKVTVTDLKGKYIKGITTKSHTKANEFARNNNSKNTIVKVQLV